MIITPETCEKFEENEDNCDVCDCYNNCWGESPDYAAKVEYERSRGC